MLSHSRVDRVMAEERTNSDGSVLTVFEVATALRCSKAHVHNLINGKVSGVQALPFIQLGRRRLVRRQTFIEWILSNEHRG